MADNELAALIPDPKPSWLIRAMDPKSPTTDQNEPIRSASSYVKELGGEVL